MGLDENNQTFNINADTVAAAIAKELKARRLIIISDVEGVLNNEKKLIPEINSKQAKQMIDDEIISGGMIPKINNCLDVAKNGVKAVCIIDGKKNHSILFELLSDKRFWNLNKRMKNLLDIKHWIFDLDNTLYSGQTKVFSEVDKKMSTFISEKMNVDLIKAKEIQKKYFYEYGTTLSGLMKQDNIDPYDFLDFVHDIDISWLPKDLKLRKELIKIEEKKYIFTNGSHAHVKNVTKQLGIDGLFDGAFDIVDANFVPKPHIDPYQKMIKNLILIQKNQY